MCDACKHPPLPHTTLLYRKGVTETAGYKRPTEIPRYTSNRFTSFRLYEINKLIPVFQFTSQFSLIRAPSSRKPSVSNGKLILVLRVFALRAVLEERIKLVNRYCICTVTKRKIAPSTGRVCQSARKCPVRNYLVYFEFIIMALKGEGRNLNVIRIGQIYYNLHFT
jgi:hypothetical protein